MAFNFNLSDVQPANTTSYLKPYNIYSGVTIDSIETKEGTSSNGNAWKSMVITFKCAEGVYSHSIFWINSDKDFERGSVDMPNGGKRELPSSWERTRDTMAAIGFAFFPDTFAKLQAASSKAKSFDEIATAFMTLVQKAIGKNPTNMKLVGRNSSGMVYATLPNCTGIAQAKDEKRAASNKVNVGDWYTWMVTPFGDNLTFSAYEEKQAAEYRNARPTAVDNSSKATDDINNFDAPAGSEIESMDDLLGGL